MIGNDHVRFGRGPSGKGLAAASTSPDGLPRLHPSRARHATTNHAHRSPPGQPSLNVTMGDDPGPRPETAHLPGIARAPVG